ncbi:hypothetical protein FQN50_002760 [Emmonsiellopsis sp. PD_5]|nr:hypothetical protein FQN50_002760 [Emmonsiellopsis sp. PD_5]
MNAGFGNRSPKVARTPLTRQNLTYAEDRIRKLEAAFSALLPNVDIDAFLNPSPPQALGGPRKQKGESSQKPAPPTASKDVTSDAASEALPQLADGFDWAEKELTLSELSDGMAALSIRPEGAGYLGAPASVAPLRALLMGGWDVNSSAQSTAEGRAARDAQSMLWQSTYPGIEPSQVVAQTVLDAYFANYHTAYPFLHEETFRAQFNEQIPRPRGHAWPILLNTVLALGAWTIGDDNVDIHETFYNEANRYLQDVSVFEMGNLALVQAFLLLSNYTQKRNKPNTGWNYLGLAIRMALSLGLHKEFPEWNISLLQREMRRRVWWGVFIFDSGASITFGRPILLPDASIMDAKQVKNIHPEALTPTTTAIPVETDQPTLYSSLIAQSKFHLTTNSLYHRLLSNRNLSAEETLKLQIPIDEWLSSLPPYFERDDNSHTIGPTLSQQPFWFLFARKRLSWRRWNFQIILYRPILLRWATQRWKRASHPDTDPEPLGPSSSSTTTQSQSQSQSPDQESRMRCLQSARATIISINEFVATTPYSRLAGWYMLYFLFQAALIPVLFLITTPTSPYAPSWLSDIQTARYLLSQHCALGKNNRLAARCLEVINRLCGPLSFPSLEPPPDLGAGAGFGGHEGGGDGDGAAVGFTADSTPGMGEGHGPAAAAGSGAGNDAWETNMMGIIPQEVVQNQEMVFSDAYSFFTGGGGNQNMGNLGFIGGGGGGDVAGVNSPTGVGPGLDVGAAGGFGLGMGGEAGIPGVEGGNGVGAGLEFFDWTRFGAEGAREGEGMGEQGFY